MRDFNEYYEPSAKRFIRVSRNHSLVTVIFVSAFLLHGCASPPLEETKDFNKSVLAAKATADPLFDELSVSEKAVHAARANHNLAAAYTLAADDALYYSTVGDGPSTTKIRAAFAVLVDFSSTMVSLADGTSASQSKSQIQLLITSVAEIAKFTELAPVASALSPFLDQALGAESVARERSIMIRAAPALQDLLFTLKQSVPAMYALLIADVPVTAHPSAEQSKRLSLARAQLGDFVFFLDKISDSLGKLEVALQHPGNPTSLSVLASTAGELDADVVAARKAYATIRATSHDR